jgi:hypothetical protein
MLGSAGHVTTGASMRWLIEQIRQNGLPPGTRVVVAGTGTERLLPAGQTVTGLQLRGWVAQDELDQLLTRAQAALIPQQLGFGALTRLSEFACAGIPAIVSRSATYAIDLPPGVVSVADRWPAWRAALDEVRRLPQQSGAEYETWERHQPCPWPILFEGWPK